MLSRYIYSSTGKGRTRHSHDYLYNVDLNVRGPFNNHRALIFRILAHTRLYRNERTLELTVPSQFITFSLYFVRIYKYRSISSALFDVLVLIFSHSCAEFVWVICVLPQLYICPACLHLTIFPMFNVNNINS